MSRKDFSKRPRRSLGILEDSPTAAAAPSGIYSPDTSINHFARSDRRNLLYRQFAYRDLKSKYSLDGKLIELGAGCGGSALVWREVGFDVLATDLRDFFVNHMRELGLRAEVVDATDIAAALGDETFDVAYGSGLTPLVRRIKSQALKTYESIHRALNPGGYFIFDSASLPGEYDANSHFQIIRDQGLFELVDSERLKAIPARLYTQWNRHLLYYAEKFVFRHVFGISRRYILRKVS
jgi:SAM-dependent methyltransferase